jgi:hypothetical protein
VRRRWRAPAWAIAGAFAGVDYSATTGSSGSTNPCRQHACPPEQERGGRWAACWIRSSAGAAQRGGSKQAPVDRAFRVSGRVRHEYPPRGRKQGVRLAPTWRPCRTLGAAPPLTRTRSQSGTKQSPAECRRGLLLVVRLSSLLRGHRDARIGRRSGSIANPETVPRVTGRPPLTEHTFGHFRATTT